jgi:hypothetical protein
VRPSRPGNSARLCQLKISIDGIRPQIWRRLVVSHNISLERLHNVFQIALGWTNSHLHSFKANGVEYQIDYGEFDFDYAPEDEELASLDYLVSKSKLRFSYEYDFGDSWEHTVVLERFLPATSIPEAPICLAGANAAPPEDCGNTTGYLELRRILKNPNYADYSDIRGWAGRKFDPHMFDITAVNKRLDLYRKKGKLTASMIPDIRMR